MDRYNEQRATGRANPDTVDVDEPEQGEPEARDESRMARETPADRVIPRERRGPQGAGDADDVRERLGRERGDRPERTVEE
ncbi:MAG TPA: hypothetical protein VFC53_03390 [Dehalococcoidia bacterium]|nr:hypothetical protein [Dehalococcoidia bacterium]